MKKIIYALMSLLFLFSACNQEEDINNSEPASGRKEVPHFYGVKYPAESENEVTTRGVAQRHKLWYACANIRIKFLDGVPEFKDIVKEAAAEWQQYAGLNLMFVENEDADVRITFDSNTRYITWSYIGTDCKKITNQQEATVNFSNWNHLAGEKKREDALRILGMVLGLEMEHRHLDVSGDWKWLLKVQNYWADIEDIDWDEMKKYVFDPLQQMDVVQTEDFDPVSIMVWPFEPVRYRPTISGVKYIPNSNLSETDKAFIRQLYPLGQCGEDKELIVIMKTPEQHVNPKNHATCFYIKMNSEVEVDWGDGTRETISVSPGKRSAILSHTYQSTGDHTIKLYGSREALTYFKYKFGELTYLDISNNYQLEELICSKNQLTFLNASGNQKLKYLDCGVNKLTGLDISTFINLEVLSFEANKAIALQVDKNINLLYLSFGGNQLAAIDLSNNLRLKELICSNNLLSALDISKNNQLTVLACGGNDLSSLDVSKHIYLKHLSCTFNHLNGLDVTNNSQLEYLSFGQSDQVSTIDLSKNKKLKYLHCSNYALTALDLSQNTELEKIQCNYTKITSLDFSHNPKLRQVACHYNPMNENAKRAMVESLPVRTPEEKAQFCVGGRTVNEYWTTLANIFSQKNWLMHKSDGFAYTIFSEYYSPNR